VLINGKTLTLLVHRTASQLRSNKLHGLGSNLHILYVLSLSMIGDHMKRVRWK